MTHLWQYEGADGIISYQITFVMNLSICSQCNSGQTIYIWELQDWTKFLSWLLCTGGGHLVVNRDVGIVYNLCTGSRAQRSAAFIQCFLNGTHRALQCSTARRILPQPLRQKSSCCNGSFTALHECASIGLQSHPENIVVRILQTFFQPPLGKICSSYSSHWM